jgi:hypothetical protein
MAIKVLECRDLIPESTCTLLFVGDTEEVVQAFTDHAARTHGGQSDIARDAIDAKLQAAVFVSPDRAYIGDDYELVDGKAVHIPGDGIVLQRFFQPETTGGGAAGGGTTLQCLCTGGPADGTCEISLHGTTAICIRGTCLTCGWSTTIPASTPPPAKILPEFE